MFNQKIALYTATVLGALTMAACQPAEGPLERAGKAADQTATKVGNEVEKAGDKIKDAVNDAKK